MTLSGKQKRTLRGLAHDLEPVVHVGKAGLTDELVAQVACALDAHELIKVRVLVGKDEKDDLVREIERATGAAEAGRVGHVTILYRRHPDPDKRRIQL
jgi:RNA-binding protein